MVFRDDVDMNKENRVTMSVMNLHSHFITNNDYKPLMKTKNKFFGEF